MSTHFFDPAALPAPDALRRRTQALAMIDAILCPEWEYRYFSFDAHWGAPEGAPPSPDNEAMASMRNGGGDEWFILFFPAGVAIKGLDHESPVSAAEDFPEAARAALPAAFAPFLDEPAFDWEWASFCYWRGAGDAAWSRVAHPDPAVAAERDGSAWMLDFLLHDAAAHHDWACGYYEADVPPEPIAALLAHTPLTRDLAQALNAELDWEEAQEYAREIGYPLA